MMTKEETLDMIIDDYKDGNQSAMSDYCDRTKCSGCPFNTHICVDDTHNILIDRLLKAEEKKETNLEHFKGNVAFDKENGIVLINLINRWKNNYSRSHEDAIDWLLSPYEPPKYKLSKFEYDLLEYHSGSKFGFRDFWILEHMQDKGYFKGVPNDVPIRDILENCEVIDDDR